MSYKYIYIKHLLVEPLRRPRLPTHHDLQQRLEVLLYAGHLPLEPGNLLFHVHQLLAHVLEGNAAERELVLLLHRDQLLGCLHSVLVQVEGLLLVARVTNEAASGLVFLERKERFG